VGDSKFGTNAITRIAWGGPGGGQKFVAVGENWTIAYAADGETWTVASRPMVPKTLSSLVWGGNPGSQKFIAAGGDGTQALTTLESADGITWTGVPDAVFNFNGMVWGAGKFVGYEIRRVIWSTSGPAWGSTRISGTSGLFGTDNISGIAYGGPAGQKRFVIADNRKIAYSEIITE
jgi:hypothetical protein